MALIASLLLLLYDWRMLPREGDAGEGPAGAGAQQVSGGKQQGGGEAAAAGGAPGDPAGLLPPPNLRKLVGIKVPAGPCWVQFERRPLAGS